jgi:hypothetical protein
MLRFSRAVGDPHAIRDGELGESSNCFFACCAQLRDAAAAFRKPFASTDFAFLFLSRFLFGMGMNLRF